MSTTQVTGEQSMPGMTVGGDESVWRRLSTPLNQVGQGEDEDHRLLGIHPVFYAAEQVGDHDQMTAAGHHFQIIRA